MKAALRKLRKPRVYQALSLIFAVAIAVGVLQFSLDNIEFFTYDQRVRLKPSSPQSGRIALVTVEASTHKQLQQDPSLAIHTQLLKRLAQVNPHTVAYILDPSELSGTKQEQLEFVKATQQLRQFVYIVNDLADASGEASLRLAAPFDELTVMAGPKTADKNIFAKDGATRRMILKAEGVTSAHPRLAAQISGRPLTEGFRGTFDFIGTEQAFIDFRPTGRYPKYAFESVLAPNSDLSSLKDKIVLIGRNDFGTSKDYIMTPQSKDIVAMSAVEMHANMLDTLILNRAPVRLPKWVTLLVTLALSFLTLWVVINVRPDRGLLLLATTVAAYVLSAHLGFMLFGVWLPMAHPLLAIFICYYFFIPYRLILENRRSWEYFQKNKLLTQVEELKSNFLRMMSHDLKTPLARIQGMSSVMLADTNPLSDGQKRALSHIIESADELSEFVASILNLGRIESKEIKLNLKSRDINQLLNEVIQKQQYFAKSKNIEIKTEFEPLFSVKIDEDLLRQVFTNLLENAIKYSPENSKILLTTEESMGQVIVQVADQGLGISAEELENVFAKFYRSKRVVNTDIPGSGLGLYLARYFVELHNGQIDVESEPGKGSTFTVTLPMDLNPQPPVEEFQHV